MIPGMLIDSHVHLCDDTLFSQAEVLIERALAATITNLVVICTNTLELDRALTLQQRHPLLISIVASTTPHEAHTRGDDEFSAFEEAARKGQLVALGETGLEYYHIKETKVHQINLFKRYLSLAQDLSLPVVIHCRDAFEDFFQIIDQFPNVKGVLHCFTGSLENAKELVKRGWMISFSGILTFKKSAALQEAASWVPVENILVETDAPYLAPQSKRGKVNEPSYLPEILTAISALKGQDVEEQVYTNTRRFFKI